VSHRTAIVTGATSGIGHAVARRLHTDGFSVLVTGRDLSRGKQVVDELGAHAVFVPLDLTAPGAPGMLADAAINTFGRLDVIVNNAARDHTGVLTDVPLDDVRAVFETNVLAAIAVLQEGAKRMTDGGSSINITSRLASIGIPTMGIYGAAKGALKTLTTAAAIELADRNIRVNAVAPGQTRTPLYDAWLREQADPEAVERDVIAGIPLGRLAEPEDVAAVVSFLASDEAAYLTGVSIPVDGGYTAH
jgi:NAD(P)-dependent dehydrogenase (short-subunit alcohol dehydrogenase family)